MQNRYVGDIGDFLKFAILRALSNGRRMGVAWWLVPDENHNRDGRHIDYLRQPDLWRHFDPVTFDVLAQVVQSGRRDVHALEEALLLRNCSFASEFLPLPLSSKERPKARAEWFAKTGRCLQSCDFIFLDPDNGLEPLGFRATSKKAPKCVTLSELTALKRNGRSMLVYHHQSRRAGGHIAEIAFQADRLRAAGFSSVDALRAKPYSPRAYFLLEATDELREAAKQFAGTCGDILTWHPAPTLK